MKLNRIYYDKGKYVGKRAKKRIHTNVTQTKAALDRRPSRNAMRK